MSTDRDCCGYDHEPFGLWVQSLTSDERRAAAEANNGQTYYRLPTLVGPGGTRIPHMGGTGRRVVAYGRVGALRSSFALLALCAACGRGEKGPEVRIWGRPSLDRMERHVRKATRGEWALTLDDVSAELGVYVWAAVGVVPDGLTLQA